MSRRILDESRLSWRKKEGDVKVQGKVVQEKVLGEETGSALAMISLLVVSVKSRFSVSITLNARVLEKIRAEGLNKGKRHHVHLSSDVPTAIAVGQRHGKP